MTIESVGSHNRHQSPIKLLEIGSFTSETDLEHLPADMENKQNQSTTLRTLLNTLENCDSFPIIVRLVHIVLSLPCDEADLDLMHLTDATVEMFKELRSDLSLRRPPGWLLSHLTFLDLQSRFEHVVGPIW